MNFCLKKEDICIDNKHVYKKIRTLKDDVGNMSKSPTNTYINCRNPAMVYQSVHLFFALNIVIRITNILHQYYYDVKRILSIFS